MKQLVMKKAGLAVLIAAGVLTASAEDFSRIQALEQKMAEMNAEINALKGAQSDLSMLEKTTDKLSLGGYGEIHANFTESGNDLLDIHRFVIYAGYEFNEWIHLNSETELEHASTDEEYLLIEQLYTDFALSDAFSIRAGRILAPLGIVNQHHEPPLFNGVERPNVEKYIIPSTWSLDGIGIFGSPLSWLTYEVYGVGSLDDTGFTAKEGIRKGRMKGRPGINDAALTGRVDIFPTLSEKQDLRFGISGFYGGTNNKNKGGTNGNDSNNTFSMVSADFEYDVSRLHFRGVVAHGCNSDTDELTPGVGEEIFGWYLETGISALPEHCKTGKFKEADLIPFVRYERYDTQSELSGGASSSGEYDRTDVTVGVNFLLTPNFVVKADAQFVSNELSGSDDTTKYNFGMGWIFN
ncbi:MAG TPA: hypothetical protein VIR63_07380 [Pontiella sp.]